MLLPELQTEVRLTRGEFERMIRPAIGATIASLRRALQSAQVDPAQLHTVLLVGGSSRIPMVAHLVSAELGCPTSVDAHPKHAVALGAAAVGAAKAPVGPVATSPPPVVGESDHPAPPPTETAVAPGVAGVAGAAAAVPLLAAGAAAPALKAPAKRRSRPGHSASNLVPEADNHSEPDPREPADDQPDAPRRRHRAPVMLGLLLLVAALAGGGTVAFRMLSHSTPTTTTVGVSHTSSSTPSPSSKSSGGSGTLHAHSSSPITPTAAPHTALNTPRITQPTTTAPTHPTTTHPTTTWPTTTPPTTTPPTTTPPTTTSPPPPPPTTTVIAPTSPAGTP